MGSRYAIAPNGVFDTIQGEGLMLGVPMSFVRLAGCGVGCPGCDTDYSVSERMSAAEVVERLQRLPRRKWVSITGGEPTDQNLTGLAQALHACGWRVAVFTAGTKAVPRGNNFATEYAGADFVCVSPHFPPTDARWVQKSGDQINLVPGLNGLSLADWDGFDPERFTAAFVTPNWYSAAGRPEAIGECVEFARRNPGWRVGVQAHKLWGVA